MFVRASIGAFEGGLTRTCIRRKKVSCGDAWHEVLVYSIYPPQMMSMLFNGKKMFKRDTSALLGAWL